MHRDDLDRANRRALGTTVAALRILQHRNLAPSLLLEGKQPGLTGSDAAAAARAALGVNEGNSCSHFSVFTGLLFIISQYGSWCSSLGYASIQGKQFVIPDQQFVIPDQQFVIPDSIRDPVLRHHWIAGAETPDLITGA